MAIYRLFKNRAFEPEAISTMTRTYAEVCRTLGLDDSDVSEPDSDAETMVTKTTVTKAMVTKTIVAKTVIEYAQRGARDHTRLRDCVLQALGQ
jgi:hypothetical protein